MPAKLMFECLGRLTGVRFPTNQTLDRCEQLSACFALGDVAASSGLKRMRAHVRFFVLAKNQHLRGGNIATYRAGDVQAADISAW